MLQTLLSSIAGGMLAVLGFSRPEEIAWKYYRLVGYICLAIGISTATWTIRESSDNLPFRIEILTLIVVAMSGCVIVFMAPMAASHVRAFRIIGVLGGAAGIAASSFSMAKQLPSPEAQLNQAAGVTLLVIGQTAGSLYLGSITLAWLLGHAYLTATRMTIAPLRRFAKLLIYFVNARLLLVALSFGIAWGLGRNHAGTGIATLLEQSWLIVVMRIGVGLVLVSILAWMVNDCVKLRSTQSATGILYFASVAAYIGELAGQQLFLECRWPL